MEDLTKIEKNLELLNLEFAEKGEVKISGNFYNFICRIKEKHNHILHTDNAHLNSITDLIINLGYNLQTEVQHNRKLLAQVDKQIQEIKKLTENLEYIKEQNNKILREFKNKNKEVINNQEEIDKITEVLNKLNIEELKIEKKQKPYKHWLPRK